KNGDDDDDDDDVSIDDQFGEAEKMGSPKAVERIVNGNTRSRAFCHVPSECSICVSAWDLTSGGKHQASLCNINCYNALSCGHIFGGSRTQKWLQLNSDKRKCPKCNLLCLLEDVRPLRITSLRIPSVDQEQAEAEAWRVKAEDCKVKAEALKRRAEGYNQRVNAYLLRLHYFSSCLENI
ncbi:zinc finger, RING/FYVE/PHD-type containing protein, partial [Tanacetum coccineum]